MAGGTASRFETRQCRETDNVPGKLGYQDGRRWGKAEACGTNHGQPQYTRMVDCISCQHFEVTMTNLLQKHWEWQEGQKTNDEARQCETTHDACDKHGRQDAFDVARPKQVARIMEDHNVHGWIIAALLREMAGLEGGVWRINFPFAQCIRQGSVEAPR